TAAVTASANAAGTTAKTRRRDGLRANALCLAGGELSTRERSASGALSVASRNCPSSAARRASSVVRGVSPASSASSRSNPIASLADMVDPLLQVFQGAAQPCRARRLADPEHAGGARAVQLEQHAQCHHFPLRRRQLADRLLERAGQAVDQLRR